MAFIMLDKSVFDDDVLDNNPTYFYGWVKLLSLARWQEKPKTFTIRNNKVIVNKGQIAESLEGLAEAMKVSKPTAKKIVDYLEKNGYISVKRGQPINIISVVNFNAPFTADFTAENCKPFTAENTNAQRANEQKNDVAFTADFTAENCKPFTALIKDNNNNNISSSSTTTCEGNVALKICVCSEFIKTIDFDSLENSLTTKKDKLVICAKEFATYHEHDAPKAFDEWHKNFLNFVMKRKNDLLKQETELEKKKLYENKNKDNSTTIGVNVRRGFEVTATSADDYKKKVSSRQVELNDDYFTKQLTKEEFEKALKNNKD